MTKDVIVAIDGPAGSGKSTVSKRVAKKLDLFYLDTGAMYRALTLKVMRNNVDSEDASSIIKIACKAEINLTLQPGEDIKVFLDGEDISGAIRTPEVTEEVQYIARIPEVRERMVQMQRRIAGRSGAVVEGRDIGTVVLPDARFKFYLDATEDERAGRRFKELKEMGIDVKLNEIKSDVQKRDASDMSRKVAPLKKAEGAIYIDTTGMSIEEVVEKIISYITQK